MNYLIKNKTLGDFYTTYVTSSDPALSYRGTTYTYEQVTKSIRQFASYFKQLDLCQGEVLALCCQNNPEFIYSYLGAVQAGAIVTPLNLTLTLEEMAYILRDSNARMLVIHEKILLKLQRSAAEIKQQFSLKHVVVLKDEVLHMIQQLSVYEPPVLNPQDVCTLLYTSGTTGKPKGVMLTHQNLLANAASCCEAIEISNRDVFQGVLPFFHTFGFTVTVLLPLLTGSKVIIADTFQPKEIITSIQTHRVTIFPGVPSMLMVLAQALKNGNLSFPSLRLLISGGAPLPGELLRTFKETLHIPAIEGYGLTEASPVVCFNPIDQQRAGSIGKPLPGISVKIIDEHGDSLPPHTPGELVVQGENVMKGYLNLPNETAATFIDGWLCTGDIAYEDEEGYLFIVDRKKDMIITGGFNVYPREIEECLYEHPSVVEAAVIGVPDSLRGEKVKAFLVLNENGTLDKKDVLAFLKPKLATYKLPKDIVFLEELPKNATGKIMKKSLQ